VEELPIAYCPLPIEKRINGQSPVNGQSAMGNGQSPVYAWHLAGVERAKKLRKPKGHPQPVWFKPF
jgi:hypothetical protein